MNNDFYSPSQVNSSTTITGKVGYDLYVVGATANFTANSVPVVVGTNNNLCLTNSPLKVSGNITGASIGTVFYYYYGL